MKIVFLLGAGASKTLEIPTTEDMVNEFRKNSTNKLLENLFCKAKIEDIETLVKAVHQIKELENNHGIKLLEAQGNKLSQIKEISQKFEVIEKELTDFIREKCLNPNLKKAVEQYTELIKLSDISIIKIFTTNYDVIIEEVCHTLKIRYSDGFEKEQHGYDNTFDPRSLGKKKIHLYKIHGSVNWWADDSRQKIIKLSPDMNAGLDKYTNTMIYPAEKENIFNYPFNMLQWFFNLELDRTTKLIAIGHKFGDPNITATVKAALDNPNFELILVNPSASKIKEEIFSNHGRVTTFDIKIEEWIKDGIPNLREEIISYNKKQKETEEKIQEEKKTYENKIKELENQLDANRSSTIFGISPSVIDTVGTSPLSSDVSSPKLVTGDISPSVTDTMGLSSLGGDNSPSRFIIGDDSVTINNNKKLCSNCVSFNPDEANHCMKCGKEF